MKEEEGLREVENILDKADEILEVRCGSFEKCRQCWLL